MAGQLISTQMSLRTKRREGSCKREIIANYSFQITNGGGRASLGKNDEMRRAKRGHRHFSLIISGAIVKSITRPLELATGSLSEAARAGEAGQWFTVVAEEVRNLAQKSGESAKSTAGQTSVSPARLRFTSQTD
jgi:hypothetical protein